MVSILMATYNGARYLEEQLDSIINQTYQDWSLWIHDDGSKDNTLAILESYCQRYPDRINLMESQKKNLGAKGNFAFIYETVKEAEYYVFCDQDDIWNRDKLSRLISVMNAEDIREPALIYHNVQVVNQEKKLIANSYFEYNNVIIREAQKLQQILMYNYIPGCTMMLNHSLKKKIACIPEGCIMHDWWILLSAIALNAKMIKVNQTLGRYRLHHSNNMGLKKETNSSSLLQCFDLKNLKGYRDNNLKMKADRIKQTTLLLQIYGEDLSQYETILKDFLQILKSKHKLINYYTSVKKGFVLQNTIKTLKFYLI